MADSVEETLKERGKTHGLYEDHALYTQRIKEVVELAVGVRRVQRRPPLTPTQRESLDMIAHKIGRILAGDASFVDHWHDIAGYAALCEHPISYERNSGTIAHVQSIADRAPPLMPDLDNEMQPCQCDPHAPNSGLECEGIGTYPPGYYCRKTGR